MAKLFAIGEVLIDFIPIHKGLTLKEVPVFERAPGGAPANVAAAVAKFGGKSSMITKLGVDPFGDFLIEQLQNVGVETDKIFRTDEAKTALAFVSLKENGERDFSFYRNPSADMLLTAQEIDPRWFYQGDFLHFCSLDLIESPMKYAHLLSIDSVIRANGLVCFDPNIRLSLWKSKRECREAIQEFLPLAHILKVAEDELEFITGHSNIEDGIEALFTGNVQAVIYTKGAKGADLYLSGVKYESKGYTVKVEDTTGAGDAFIGGFLYKLMGKKANRTNLESVLNSHYQEILEFANASGALTVTGKGAISSLPLKEEVIALIGK